MFKRPAELETEYRSVNVYLGHLANEFEIDSPTILGSLILSLYICLLTHTAFYQRLTSFFRRKRFDEESWLGCMFCNL